MKAKELPPRRKQKESSGIELAEHMIIGRLQHLIYKHTCCQLPKNKKCAINLNICDLATCINEHSVSSSRPEVHKLIISRNECFFCAICH